MSIPVIISGSTFNIPSQGDSPPWGDSLSSLLQAIVTTLNGISGGNDISATSFLIANNQILPSNITGLSFDSSQVRSSIISYSISRSTMLNELSECGQLMVTYTSSTGTWELAQYEVGNSEVVFSISNSGQIQFTSSNMLGANYVGKIKFFAKSFTQT